MHSVNCVQLLGCISRNHGWIAFPPYPLARIAAASSTRLRTILTLERAHTRPYTAWRQRQAALRRRVASLISGRLRGTFPLGLPECIRQTALPCVRGPDRAPRLCRGCCWLAALCLEVLQQPPSVLYKVSTMGLALLTAGLVCLPVMFFIYTCKPILLTSSR